MSTLGYNWKLWKIMANVATYNPILGRFPQDYCPLDYSFLCESLLDNCLLNNFYLGLHPLDDSVPDNPPHPPLIPTEYCLLFLWVKGNTLRIHVLKKIKENENFERKVFLRFNSSCYIFLSLLAEKIFFLEAYLLPNVRNWLISKNLVSFYDGIVLSGSYPG